MNPMTDRPEPTMLRTALLPLLACTWLLAVEPPAALPAGGTPLFGDDPLSAMGLDWGAQATVTIVRADELPGLTARRVVTAAIPAKPWDLQGNAVSTAAVAKGDTVFIELFARTIQSTAETGEAGIGITLERQGGDWAKTLYLDHGVGRSWTRLAMAVRVIADYPAGGMHFGLRAGFRPQTIELAGLRVVAFPATVDPASLPVMRFDYPGRSEQADWRTAAEERIRRLRQGDLRVRVLDAAGAPVAGAQVSIAQTRHRFPFGNTVDAFLLQETTPDAERYRAFVAAHFNMVSIENHLKQPMWSAAEGWAGKRVPLAAIRWLREQGIAVKGHTLVWPHPQYLPESYRQLDGPRRQAGLLAHIADILGATRGQVAEWDCLNEPYDSPIIAELGSRGVAAWFTAAAAAAGPGGPRLGLNDFCHLVGGADEAHKASTERLVAELKAAGAPLGYYGIQAHLGRDLLPPARVVAELNRLHASLGLPLSITEFDLVHIDPAIQYDYSRDFLIACFSSPGVESILAWGFWRRNHWLPAAAWVDEDWSVLPPGKAWFDLVEGAWRTRASATTGADGIAAFRGFHGAYAVTCGSASATAEIAPGAADLVEIRR